MPVIQRSENFSFEKFLFFTDEDRSVRPLLREIIPGTKGRNRYEINYNIFLCLIPVMHRSDYLSFEKF